MTVNSDLEAAWRYHNTTKHSYASVHNNLHFLDWANQPLPFKIYVTLDPLSLPREVRQTGVAALSAIAESIYPEPRAVPDLEALALLLYLTVGITRHRKYAGGDIYFRAAACTGALYEVRSEEHTSDSSHLVISYAVFCLKKKKIRTRSKYFL